MSNYHLTKLPDQCCAKHPVTGETILIKRGENGYHPMSGTDGEGFNKLNGITSSQVEAMLVGSMWGWDVPGADPDLYRERKREARP